MARDAVFYDRLAHQGLGRPLSVDESEFAAKLERLFAAGVHDFHEVAAGLNEVGCARPSGHAGAWTADVLLEELAEINRQLDAAYESNGSERSVYR